MPTPFTHAVPALIAASLFFRPVPRFVFRTLFWALSLFAALAPDLDVVAFLVGIPYEHPLGHRGASHSLLFAFATALIYTIILRRLQFSYKAVPLFAYFFFITATHPLLDMLTNGGLGMAIYWPISNQRHFFEIRPIRVSPIGGLDVLFSERMKGVLLSEFKWVWTPAAAFYLTARITQVLYKRAKKPVTK